MKRSPALRALYNNLKKAGETPALADHVAEALDEYAVSNNPILEKAMEIDAVVKRVRPDGWRGIQAREQVIKAALYKYLQDEAEVERIFLIVKAQSEYCSSMATTGHVGRVRLSSFRKLHHPTSVASAAGGTPRTLTLRRQAAFAERLLCIILASQWSETLALGLRAFLNSC